MYGLLRIVRSWSYNAGKVDKGDPLRILCAHTIAIGVSDVDVHIETLVNIGRILNTLMIRSRSIGSSVNISLTGRLKFCMRSSLCWESIWPNLHCLICLVVWGSAQSPHLLPPHKVQDLLLPDTDNAPLESAADNVQILSWL